jgi:putrescine transport system permease protein
VIPALLGAPDSLTIGRVIWDEFFQNRDWPLAASLSLGLLVALTPAALLLRRSK